MSRRLNAQLANLGPGVGLLQHTDDLLFVEPALLHRRSSSDRLNYQMEGIPGSRSAGVELREDADTVLKPGMVVSMEPMIMIPEGQPGAGGYREHDIFIITDTGAENITNFPYGLEHMIVKG